MVAELAGSFESEGFGLAVLVVTGEFVFVGHVARAVSFGNFVIVNLDIEKFLVVFKKVEADGSASDDGDDANND